jgi:hypothetical protein
MKKLTQTKLRNKVQKTAYTLKITLILKDKKLLQIKESFHNLYVVSDIVLNPGLGKNLQLSLRKCDYGLSIK